MDRPENDGLTLKLQSLAREGFALGSPEQIEKAVRAVEFIAQSEGDDIGQLCSQDNDRFVDSLFEYADLAEEAGDYQSAEDIISYLDGHTKETTDEDNFSRSVSYGMTHSGKH